jgi:hypothetical protein
MVMNVYQEKIPFPCQNQTEVETRLERGRMYTAPEEIGSSILGSGSWYL